MGVVRADLDERGGRLGSGKAVSAAEAISIAERYPTQARSGEQAEPEAQTFPGYFTLDTTRDGKVVGMLSVNASTGAVWYHDWQGRFRGGGVLGAAALDYAAGTASA